MKFDRRNIVLSLLLDFPMELKRSTYTVLKLNLLEFNLIAVS